MRIVRDLTNATADEARALLESYNYDVRKVLDILRPAAIRQG